MAALIFGASKGGIAAAIARGLRAGKVPVHLVGRNEETLRFLEAELDVTTTKCDFNDEASIAAAVVETERLYGGIDSIAYAGGSIRLAPVARLTPEMMIETFRLNVVGAAMAVKHSKNALSKSSNGSCVLFSSVAARQGFPMHVDIGSSKAAIHGLTISLAAELAGKVRVNCIAPSLTNTPLASQLLGNEGMLKAIKAAHPIPRVGEAEDVAEIAQFLMSEKSSWMTGQIIGVDGGRSTLRHKNQ